MAVLNPNRPAFYLVTPKLFAALVEELADHNLVAIARQRLMRKASAIGVDIDQIYAARCLPGTDLNFYRVFVQTLCAPGGLWRLKLQAGRDSTRETTPAELAAARHLTVTRDPEALAPLPPLHRHRPHPGG